MIFRQRIFVLISLLVIFVVLHLARLTSDPPKNLSWGRGPFTDEGFYSHNARNKALFGKWSLDDYNYYYISPVTSLSNYLAFRYGGIKYSSIRFLAMVFGFFSVLLLYKISRFNVDIATAIIGVFLFTFNYFYLMYSRLFISEIPMLFFIVACFYSLQKKSALAYLSAGIFFMLAILSKSLALFFCPVILYKFWQERDNRLFKKIIIFGSGFLLITGVWFILLVLPDPAKFYNFYKIYITRVSPKYFSQVLQVFHTEFFAQLPLLTIFTLISFKFYKQFNQLEREMVVWLFAALFSLMLFSYTTGAYYLILLPPMIVLSADFLRKILAGDLLNGKFSVAFYLPWGIISYLLGRYILIYCARDFYFQSIFTKVLLELSVVILLFIMVKFSTWIVRHQSKKKFYGLITLFLLLDFSPYLYWYLNPSYKVLKTMSDLRNNIREGVIAGSWAPALCLETSLREFPFGDGVVNTENLGKKIPLTHLLLEREKEETIFVQEHYPGLLSNAHIVRTYDINNYLIDLWKLNYDKK